MFIFRKNRIIVKRIKCKFILVCNGTLKIEETRVKRDIYHKLLHSGVLEGKKSESMNLKKVFSDPESILELEGKKKINLLLFLMFTKRIQVFDLSNAEKYMLSSKQRELFDLISADKKLLDKIFSKYPKTFIKICDYFCKEEETEKTGDLDVLDRYDYQQLLEKKQILECLLVNKTNNVVNRLSYNIHIDFCKRSHKDRSALSEFKNNYETFIEKILHDQPSSILFENKIFYPELMLYNDLILSNYDYSFIDLQLFANTFTTLNERGVRDYMKRKLEKSQNE